MVVEVGSHVRVEDLMRVVIVHAGNEACIGLAEGLAGSEEPFAEIMNETGREFGMTGSHFTNATGWPDPDQRVTARDLATLAKRTILAHPAYYHSYGEKEFTWSEIRPGTRHPLRYRENAR